MGRMGRLDVFTAAIGVFTGIFTGVFAGVFMGVFVFLLCFPNSAVLAQNATTLDVSAPSSVDIDEDFSVTAAYKSNDTNLCGATCSVDDGWLSGPVYMSETAGCEYSAVINAPGDSGSYTLDVYCNKAGYDYQLDYFGIDVDKLDSELSVDISPASPSAGDTVSVNAYYKDDYGDAIAGSCSARLRENGMEIDYIDMEYYGLYRGELVLPEGTGDYTITVTCSSDQYETESDSVSFEVTKESADMRLSHTGTAYYGQDVEINADYTHQGSMISGTCTMSFDSTEREMDYSHTGYSGTVRIPYAEGPYEVGVECSSGSYETREGGIAITPLKRPASVAVVSPEERRFYPTDEILIKISYLDSLTGEGVADARCLLDGSELEAKDGYHVAEVSNLGIGTLSLSIRCSGQFHGEDFETLTVNIIRIPVDIGFVEARGEYRYGEEIRINASVVSVAGDESDISCSARVDSYDLLFNSLLDYYTADLVREEGMRVLTIPNTGRPSRMVVSVTCSGDVHEEKTARMEFVTRQLSRETEGEMVVLLSAVSLVLVALILLIRRKLKIL
jgi:hypothetical protein